MYDDNTLVLLANQKIVNKEQCSEFHKRHLDRVPNRSFTESIQRVVCAFMDGEEAAGAGHVQVKMRLDLHERGASNR